MTNPKTLGDKGDNKDGGKPCEYSVELDFFAFRLRGQDDPPDETCAECGRVDHHAYMCWRVGHLPKKETP